MGSYEQQVEAKLQSTRFYDRIEAIERISQIIQERGSQGQDVIFINSIMLKIADVFSFQDTTNKLRAHIVKELIAKCHRLLEAHVFNKQEFTTRVSCPLLSNDPQQRMITLKMFSYLPSFIQTRIDIQHQILNLLTTTTNEQERQVANQTILMISKGSELFAKSIMNKVQETVLSGKFSTDTCKHLINAIGNVAGDSETALILFQTIEELYQRQSEKNGQGAIIEAALVRSLVKMAGKAPIILDKTLTFLMQIGCLEGIQILSRRFILPEAFLSQIEGDAYQSVLIMSN